jgi:hypothetical protein
MTVGALVCTARLQYEGRILGPPRQQVPIHFKANFEVGYIEEIEIPRTDKKHYLLAILDGIYKFVQPLLDELERAGC